MLKLSSDVITGGGAVRNKVYESDVKLTGIAFVFCVLIYSSCLTRVLGFGMMEGNKSAANGDSSPEATFAQNEANCLKLDDGWWSPIAGPVIVNLCAQGIKDKQGNLLLSGGKDLKVTTSQDKKLSQEEKDYNKGLVDGVFGSFRIGQSIGKDKNIGNYTQEQIDKRVSVIVEGATSNKSDAYKLGLLRGAGLGSDFVTTFGVSGIEKQK